MTNGSSPLTRGKRGHARPHPVGGGLIPAHAGKTRPPVRTVRRVRAHPRSRGENRRTASLMLPPWGSSPLTRGKLDRRGCLEGLAGLIPAHAGKTMGPSRRPRGVAAHPRSRGENQTSSSSAFLPDGSSPLTRGKLRVQRRAETLLGLIPAHAGKTHDAVSEHPELSAHPRSRGENPIAGVNSADCQGSSPLTRGKPGMTVAGQLYERLIPAHAGKTRPSPPTPKAPWAHPRSRGENVVAETKNFSRAGSSPLTRGKPVRASRCLARLGLIPAHAGKTAGIGLVEDAEAGSSPLTRGKRSPVYPAGHARGLIPAHAGKTTRCPAARPAGRAHPRSRGENPRRCDLRF